MCLESFKFLLVMGHTPWTPPESSGRGRSASLPQPERAEPSQDPPRRAPSPSQPALGRHRHAGADTHRPPAQHCRRLCEFAATGCACL